MFQYFSSAKEGPSLNLEVRRVDFDLDEPLKPEEVIVRIEAAPINPSDIGTMLLGFRPKSLSEKKSSDGTVLLECTSDDAKANKSLQAKIGASVACGNEGAGTVVRAGSSAQHLMGKIVAVQGQAYVQYKKVNMSKLIPHNEGTTAAEAASSFVNPMTVLCMVETMSREKHNAIIHTAAASNLGQMLQRVCDEDGIALVNIVRKQEQEEILRSIGAKYVVRSDKDTFFDDLVEAIVATKATLAFDAVGGGDLADTILAAMEKAAKKYSKQGDTGAYGTDVFKQLYVYGGLDSSPTPLTRRFGFSFAYSGFLLPRVLSTFDGATVKRMFKRVADTIKTTFKTSYYKEVSLADAVKKENFLEYVQQKTGKKYYINPSLDGKA